MVVLSISVILIIVICCIIGLTGSAKVSKGVNDGTNILIQTATTLIETIEVKLRLLLTD